MKSLPGTQGQPLASHTSSKHLSGCWLTLARVVWLVCASLLLVNFVASIPAYYHLLNTTCTLADQRQCAGASGQRAPAIIQLLARLYIPLSGYATFFTIVDVLVSLLAWGVGLLIFWRKSNEGMGLLTSRCCLCSWGLLGALTRSTWPGRLHIRLYCFSFYSIFSLAHSGLVWGLFS